MTLTEAGEAMAHHARLITRPMAIMRGELGEYATGLRSTVRLLVNTAAMTELLPQRLAGWMGANPRIDLDLKERQSTEIARSVAAGFADIGIEGDFWDWNITITSQGQPLAQVRNQFSGVGRYLTGKNTYHLSIAEGLDPQQHAGLIGAVMCMDMLRTKAQQSNG